MPLQYRFFRIPVRDPEPWEAELNQFLGSVRAARVQRGFNATGLGAKTPKGLDIPAQGIALGLAADIRRAL